ncbi:MAG: SprT family zinc-dependent metalloprotease [Candidatus Saccharibacteria bacterium]|nr:SprT family zinc-dependent metalloprotease [Candidatus Saccharibacteria bacterium]
MATLSDPEFGDITVVRSGLASRVSARITPAGALKITLPRLAPLMAAKMLLRTSRTQLRQLLAEHQATHAYRASQPIGKSHHLLIERGSRTATVTTAGTTIIATVPDSQSITAPTIQAPIRQAVLKALRKEAKHYLPRRLATLAERHGFSYDAVRLMHASSRWGSCSSRGTISLNIALMNLPFELIDYVLLHELAHTQQMNHSPAFWHIVKSVSPHYATHRRALKQHTPHI